MHPLEKILRQSIDYRLAKVRDFFTDSDNSKLARYFRKTSLPGW